MSYRYIAFFLSLTLPRLIILAQPYVVNEKVEKVFSEGFTDVNKSFIITPSSDPKFWGVYGDGYYYMKRKIASPRAIIVNADQTSKNFYIKSKVNLALTGTMQSSIGIIFLAQKGGKGGFIFELNKKKKFRIKELGTGAFITKEGVNGWLKSKIISSPERDNTIEIKGFRGKFDIYINGNYLYSFLNNSYEKGNYGAYIGPNAEAKIFYYNVYKLDIPGVAPEVNLDNLNQQIESLKQENDSLRTIALIRKYSNDDRTAISAIKILEKQLQNVNEENAEIKAIIRKYESKSSKNTDSINQFQSLELLTKIKTIGLERDSILEAFAVIESLNNKANLIEDSLNKEIIINKTKISFMNEELSKLKLEIAESKLTTETDSFDFIKKTPSKPSKISTMTKGLSDSISAKHLEKGILVNNDSLVYELKTPSISSKTTTSFKSENLKINKDSLAINLVENNKKENVDSVHYFEKIDSSNFVSIPVTQVLKTKSSLNTERIDSLVNSEGKSPISKTVIKDTIIVSLADSTHEVSTDSSLINLINKQPTPLLLDTFDEKSEIDLPVDTVGAIELLKKDSIYLHTLDIGSELVVDEDNEVSPSIDSTKSFKINIKKAELKE